MSNRTLTYTIKLLSDIAKQANRDAQAVEGSSRRMVDAYTRGGRGIERSTKAAERAVQQLNGSTIRAGASLDRMGNGLGARLARQADIGIARLKQMQSIAEKTGNALGKIGKGAGMTVAGGIAATAVADRVIEKPVAYESRVARMAQTAYTGKDIEGFKATQAQVDTGITSATAQGGGRRDDAAAALDNMVASGQDLKSAISALPAVMKTASASGANPKELSDIVIKGVQNGYIDNTPQAIAAAMDKAVAAGRAGQFELPDMAKWLGQQMSAGKLAGLTGEKGFNRLLMMNQSAMMAAGSKDEAGNNVVNLLGKLNSADTAKDFKKQGNGDLSKYLISAEKKGGDSVDAWVALLREEMAKNKDYQTAQKALNDAKTPEQQRNASEAITNLAMGTSVGTYFQDRQAMAALIPLLADKTGVGAKVNESIMNAKGTVDFGYETYGTTSAFKLDQAANVRDQATTDAFNELKPAIDSVITSFTALGQAMPTGAAAVAGAGGIMTTVGADVAGAGAFNFGMDWLKKRKPKPDATDAHGMSESSRSPHQATAVNAPEAPRRRNAAGQLIDPPVKQTAWTVSHDADAIMTRSVQDVERLKNARLAGRIGGLASAAVGVYDAYKIIGDEHTTRGQKAQGLSEVAGAGLGGWGGAYAGAAAGAALGSIVPILGTAVGGVLGGLAGGFFGSKYGGEMGNAAGGMARSAIDGSTDRVLNNSAQSAQVSAAVQAGVAQGFQGLYGLNLRGTDSMATLGRNMVEGTSNVAMTNAVQTGVSQGLAGMPNMLAAAMPMPNIMQQPPAFQNLPMLNQTPPPPQAVDLSIKDGKLQVQVQVNASSQLIEATARASTPVVPLQLASGGNTNPASYNYGGQR